VPETVAGRSVEGGRRPRQQEQSSQQDCQKDAFMVGLRIHGELLTGRLLLFLSDGRPVFGYRESLWFLATHF
jgi:hypothetical protein